MQNQFHKVYKRMWDDSFHKCLVKGSKKDLYAYIGYMYSNSLEQIDRIGYEEVTERTKVDEFNKYYTVDEHGHLHEHDFNKEMVLKPVG